MAYTGHRPDLISAEVGKLGWLTLYRTINGQVWSRRVGPSDFLSPMEAAVALKVHRTTVYDWMAQGLIQAYEGEYGHLVLWDQVWKFGRLKGIL